MTKSNKEIQRKLVSNMHTWQKVENAAIASTGRVIEKTENPIVRLVMEIIQRDSQMHYRVQQWILDSLEGTPIAFSPDDLSNVWDMVEEHLLLEKKTIELANAALGSIEGSKGMLMQAYLLEYLLEDERKHEQLLERLASIQKGMYPYA